MNEYEAIVLTVTMVSTVYAVCHFLDFITRMAEIRSRDNGEAEESAGLEEWP